MDRLLVLKLDAQDCEAEAWLNGVPLARVDAARPRAILPVHEYTLAGANQLELVIWPRPAVTPAKPVLPGEPRVGDAKRAAALRILLPRIGSPADEATARTLAQLDWAPAEGVVYAAPLTLAHEVALPVTFPRWRWLDAPITELTPVLHQQALAFVQALAQELAAGETDRYLSAVRLRTEEIAIAYQRQPADEAGRLREHLLALHGAGLLNWAPLAAEGFFLRTVAGGRLLECLDASGQPALRTLPDAQGRTLALGLRLAAVDGKLYVLR